jgi:hypothetical protein
MGNVQWEHEKASTGYIQRGQQRISEFKALKKRN